MILVQLLSSFQPIDVYLIAFLMFKVKFKRWFLVYGLWVWVVIFRNLITVVVGDYFSFHLQSLSVLDLLAFLDILVSGVM